MHFHRIKYVLQACIAQNCVLGLLKKQFHAERTDLKQGYPVYHPQKYRFRPVLYATIFCQETSYLIYTARLFLFLKAFYVYNTLIRSYLYTFYRIIIYPETLFLLRPVLL